MIFASFMNGAWNNLFFILWLLLSANWIVTVHSLNWIHLCDVIHHLEQNGKKAKITRFLFEMYIRENAYKCTFEFIIILWPTTSIKIKWINYNTSNHPKPPKCIIYHVAANILYNSNGTHYIVLHIDNNIILYTWKTCLQSHFSCSMFHQK